jgi:predicted metal-binding protein
MAESQRNPGEHEEPAQFGRRAEHWMLSRTIARYRGGPLQRQLAINGALVLCGLWSFADGWNCERASLQRTVANLSTNTSYQIA